jgi:hypothetical protein
VGGGGGAVGAHQGDFARHRVDLGEIEDLPNFCAQTRLSDHDLAADKRCNRYPKTSEAQNAAPPQHFAVQDYPGPAAVTIFVGAALQISTAQIESKCRGAANKRQRYVNFTKARTFSKGSFV